MLYALEVPPLGGDTSFCSMCAAWDELPAPLQRRIEGLRVVATDVDWSHGSGPEVRGHAMPLMLAMTGRRYPPLSINIKGERHE